MNIFNNFINNDPVGKTAKGMHFWLCCHAPAGSKVEPLAMQRSPHMEGIKRNNFKKGTHDGRCAPCLRMGSQARRDPPVGDNIGN